MWMWMETPADSHLERGRGVIMKKTQPPLSHIWGEGGGGDVDVDGDPR
jgi:hypothetical protein